MLNNRNNKITQSDCESYTLNCNEAMHQRKALNYKLCPSMSAINILVVSPKSEAKPGIEVITQVTQVFWGISFLYLTK